MEYNNKKNTPNEETVDGYERYANKNLNKHLANYLKAMNRPDRAIALPKNLKKKTTLPEYKFIMILCIIVFLPYSLIQSLIYVCRIGQAKLVKTKYEKDQKRDKGYLRYIVYLSIFILSPIFIINDLYLASTASPAKDTEAVISETATVGFIEKITTGADVREAQVKLIIADMFDVKANKELNILDANLIPKDKINDNIAHRILNFLSFFIYILVFVTIICFIVILVDKYFINVRNGDDLNYLSRHFRLKVYDEFDHPIDGVSYNPLAPKIHGTTNNDSVSVFSPVIANYCDSDIYIRESGLTFRFLNPFAYRYYCMSHGYIIPVQRLARRTVINYEEYSAEYLRKMGYRHKANWYVDTEVEVFSYEDIR